MGMQRLAPEGLARAAFDDPTEIHDDDPVRDVLDDCEIMRDEEIRNVQAIAKIDQKMITCALTDTSSADTGSSQMTSFGPNARALAMPMRCRCPPESSLGYRSSCLEAGRPERAALPHGRERPGLASQPETAAGRRCRRSCGAG